MEYPSLPLPTENLYKFQALAGLACLLFFSWFFLQRAEDAELLATQAENDQRVLEAEENLLLETYTNRAIAYTNVSKELDALQTEIGQTNALTMAQEKKFERLKAVLQDYSDSRKELHSKTHELIINRVQSKNKAALAKVSINKAKRSFSLWWTFVLSSAAVSISGFVQWYWRVQVFQDRILRREAGEVAPKRPKAPKKESTKSE
jgi:hypothetical protein